MKKKRIMREREIKAMNTKETKNVNNQEMNLNEMQKIAGGMSLFELWLRNNCRNDDD